MILSPHIAGLFIQGWSIYDTFPTHCGVVYPGMVYIWYFPHTLRGCLSRDGLYNYDISPHFVGLFIQGWSICDTFPTHCGVVYPGMVYIWYFPHTLWGCLSRDGLYMILSPHIAGLFIQGWSIYDTFPMLRSVVYPKEVLFCLCFLLQLWAPEGTAMLVH